MQITITGNQKGKIKYFVNQKLTFIFMLTIILKFLFICLYQCKKAVTKYMQLLFLILYVF